MKNFQTENRFFSAFFATERLVEKICSAVVRFSSELVRISSELVEISSELVRISSELVRTISELLIISAFKKITNSASGTPSLRKNQCIRASVISPLFTFRPVVFKLFTKGYTGKTSAECRCGKADCASRGRAWSCGCRKRLFRAKKLRNSNFTKREVSIFCKMTPKACSII